MIDFQNYLETNFSNYYILEDGNCITGGFGFEINEADKTGKITWIFFHPNYKGRGLGNLSIKLCLEIANKDPRVERIIATTSQFAYKFFEKYGFKLIQKEKDYWGKGLDLYKMKLILDKTNL